MHITSNIFKISNSKITGSHQPPHLPTLKAYPTPGVGGRFGIFSLKWRERMNLKVPGAILPLDCAILSTRAKTVRGVGTTPPLRRTRLKRFQCILYIQTLLNCITVSCYVFCSFIQRVEMFSWLHVYVRRCFLIVSEKWVFRVRHNTDGRLTYVRAQYVRMPNRSYVLGWNSHFWPKNELLSPIHTNGYDSQNLTSIDHPPSENLYFH